MNRRNNTKRNKKRKLNKKEKYNEDDFDEISIKSSKRISKSHSQYASNLSFFMINILNLWPVVFFILAS